VEESSPLLSPTAHNGGAPTLLCCPRDCELCGVRIISPPSPLTRTAVTMAYAIAGLKHKGFDSLCSWQYCCGSWQQYVKQRMDGGTKYSHHMPLPAALDYRLTTPREQLATLLH
ncbi:unnamed protein product, partial [Ectocarpus fasciculatus]